MCSYNTLIFQTNFSPRNQFIWNNKKISNQHKIPFLVYWFYSNIVHVAQSLLKTVSSILIMSFGQNIIYFWFNTLQSLYDFQISTQVNSQQLFLLSPTDTQTGKICFQVKSCSISINTDEGFVLLWWNVLFGLVENAQAHTKESLKIIHNHFYYHNGRIP